jgi:quinol-cytochrome oxidoreductase complex cytochrome b subunit
VPTLLGESQRPYSEEIVMTPLYALWLPILVSAVIVYVVSTIIHMALPWHKSDYLKLPNEDKVMDALRPLAIPPGDYVVPRPASMKDMKSPEYVEKRAKGPVMVLTVIPPGPVAMGKHLVMWFIYSLVVGFFAGYVAAHALPPGTAYPEVFRFVGATAFMGYALAIWQMSIWYGRKWSTTIKTTIDGLIYALLTAGTFGWLWPH